MKTVLITGSNGLLGQALIARYSQLNDIELIATSKDKNRYPKSAGYKYFPLDITDQEQVTEAFELFKPDVVINTAAMTNVDQCEENKQKCWEINVGGVENLLAHCTNTHLVHLSTDFVFDGENGSYVETDKPNPLSTYAESKYESEKVIQNAAIDHWAIARTIIVYGKGYDLSRSNIVLWAIDALSNDQELRIVDDQFRSPTWAPDLAEGCRLIEENEATGIYHLSGPETFSMYEMVCRIADFLGKSRDLITPIKSEELARPASRPPKTGFVIDKARNELGYNPHSLEESLDKILNH